VLGVESICAAGKKAHADRKTCVDCDVGHYSNQGVDSCTGCPLGKYASALGSSSCTACLNGKYTASTGMTHSDNCTNVAAVALPSKYYVGGNELSCAAGKISTSGQSACTYCLAGTYTTDNINCLNCTTGSECTQGTAVACTPGKLAANKGSASCDFCNSTEWSGSGATTCVPCDQGYKCTGTAKVACVAGKFSIASAAVCTPCSAGEYQPDTAQNACQSCPAGKISQSQNAIACDECEPGKEKLNNTACGACTTGKYSTGGSHACTSCEAGYKCTNGNKYACEPGKHSAISATICSTTLCTAGSFCPGNGNKYDCIAGTYSRQGASFCIACTAGTYSTGVANIVCEPCPRGEFSIAGAAAIGECDPSLCEAGMYCLYGVKTACPNGKFSTSGASECTPCTQHHSCDGGVKLPCSAGQEQSLQGEITCTDCPAGTWSISGFACVEICGKGYYCDAGAKTACVSGKTTATTGASLVSDCIDCEAGYECTESSNIYERLPCDIGTYSVAGSSECAACPDGT